MSLYDKYSKKTEKATPVIKPKSLYEKYSNPNPVKSMVDKTPVKDVIPNYLNSVIAPEVTLPKVLAAKPIVKNWDAQVQDQIKRDEADAKYKEYLKNRPFKEKMESFADRQTQVAGNFSGNGADLDNLPTTSNPVANLGADILGFVQAGRQTGGESVVTALESGASRVTANALAKLAPKITNKVVAKSANWALPKFVGGTASMVPISAIQGTSEGLEGKELAKKIAIEAPLYGGTGNLVIRGALAGAGKIKKGASNALNKSVDKVIGKDIYKGLSDVSAQAPKQIKPTTGAYKLKPIGYTQEFKPVETTVNKVSTVRNKPVGENDIVYHGTNKDFKEFDKAQNKPNTLYGPGFYFTDSLKSAENYSTTYRGNTGSPRVIKAKLSHDKLWDYNNNKITPRQFEEAFNYEGDYPRITEPTKLGQLKGINDIASGLKSLGYDGFKIVEKDGSKTYAVFNPEQIKQIPDVNRQFTPSTTVQKGLQPYNKPIYPELKLRAKEQPIVKPEPYKLPDTQPELQRIYDDMVSNQSKGMTIDLQLFAELKRKLSQFKTNTIARSTMIPDDIKTKLNPNEFDYIPESSKEWQSKAVENVSNDINGVMERIKGQKSLSGGIDAHEGAVVTSALLEDAKITGDVTKLQDWLKTISSKTRETARALKGTDTAWEKKSAEGALTDAQRVIDKVDDNLKKSNPRLSDKIDNETKQAKDAINKAQKDAAKQATEELLPEQLLAIKVSGTLKEQGKRQTNPISDMVDELFKSAKESPLPERALAVKRNPIEFLRQAIQNKSQYADVWQKAQTIVKDKYASNPEITQILDDYFNKGIIPTYSQNTLNRSVQTGMKGLDQKLIDIAKSSKGDKEQALKELTDHLATATGAKAGDALLLARKIQSRFDQLVKEKSESLLKQMFREIPKKGQKSTTDKVMELINLGAYDDAAIRDLIKEKKGLPTLTKDDVKYIIKNMELAKTLPEGSYQQRSAYGNVSQLIADKIPSTVIEKFQAVQRISMLLNPKTTLVRNPLGNTLLNTLEGVKNIPGAVIDKTVSKIRGSERTTILAPLLKGKEAIKGAKQGLKEWALDIKTGVNTNPTGAGVELPNKVKIFNENNPNPFIRSVNKGANKIHSVVGNMLKLGDRPFYQAAYNSRIAELKKIKGVSQVTPEIEEMARLHALERTFQNDSEMSKIFIKSKKLSDNTVFQLFANLVLPFAKTPANILDKFIDYSPAGSLKSVYHVVSTKGKGTFNQKYFVDTLARSLTGTGMAVVGYMMAEKGLITGNRDKSSKIEGIETALGKQNYAFKIGDKYITYDWALPASAPIALGADVYNAVKNRKDGQSAVLEGSESAVNLLFKSTVLQGPAKLMSGYSPAVSIAKTLLGSTTQATPTVGKQISQLVDPYVRETYDPNPLKQTLNRTIARLPYASKSLPAKQDVFGNDVKAFQGKNNVWNVMFNPGFNTTYKPDETQKEIIRLYNDSKMTDQLPPVVTKYILETKKNPRVNLTADEYVNYQKRVGKLITNGDSKLGLLGTASIISSPNYKNSNDEQKAKYISNIVEKSKKIAKNEILVKMGLVPTK